MNRARVQNPTPSARPASRGGFTLIELIVAIVVAGIMVFLINRIFFETSNAVSLGIKTSEIIGSSRTISEQLARDFSARVTLPLDPPDSAQPGLLIIVEKNYHNVKFQSSTPIALLPPDGRTLSNGQTANGQPWNNLRDVRSDQLCFLASVSDIAPLTPGSDSTYENGLLGAFQYARIWYGHLLRTNNTGSSGAVTFGVATDADLGPGSASGYNTFGNHFILGRQALLFCGSNAGSAATPPNGSLYYDSTTGQIVDSVAPQTVNGQPLYKAFTDVSNYELYNDNAITMEPPNALFTSSISQQATPVSLYDGLADLNAGPVNGYLTRALPLVFLNSRLWVTPTPAFNSGTPYAPAQVAQMHPLFMGDVSDFTVNFAGDYNGDGTVDTDVNGSVMWYGYWFNNSTAGRRDPANPTTGTLPYDPNQSDVYLPPVGANGFNQGSAGSPIFVAGDASLGTYQQVMPTGGDAIFVFRHNDRGATSRWPSLLRIRYRLHDKNTQLADTNDDPVQQPGKWFEQVVKVNRP